MSDQPAPSNGGTHSYYDWQVSTLLLAYDVIEPLSRDDVSTFQKRQQEVELEVREIALGVIPAEYERDPEKEISPEIVVGITRATIRRAAQIVGVI